MGAEVVGGPDPGEQQQLGRVDGAAAEDHLAVGACGDGLVAVHVLDADRPPAVDDDLQRLRASQDGEIGPLARWMQEGGGGALAPSVALGDVVEGHAMLLGTVDVGVEGDSELLEPAHERLAQRIGLHLLGDVHVAADAVELVVEPLVVLGAAEVREDAPVVPALGAQAGPFVVVLWGAA